ncbi:FkbM family methyltransferase [Aliarcobacter cryaerophilus]|nr:FkbM family methyltransferase [Aliarcobacter cryaerophilus]
MQKFIPLEELVEKEKLDFIESVENIDKYITKVKIRDVECCYFTNSKRTLWQAVGIEYIEPEMLDYIESLEEDSVFYDIGASNGIFSVYAMQKSLKVFSFEPEIQNFSLLGANSYLNKNSKHQHKLFNIAISDKNSIGNMFIAKFEGGGHMKILDKAKKVGEKENFIPDFTQNVLTYNLDSFIEKYSLPAPEHIKIDVDGAEMAVIKGAINTLKNKTLKSIFIELEDNNKYTIEIINIIKKSGFIESKKVQVQNYEGLNNYIFTRNLYE